MGSKFVRPTRNWIQNAPSITRGSCSRTRKVRTFILHSRIVSLLDMCKELHSVSSKYSRAIEVAACHLSHISAAMFHDGKIFMWGHCRGHSIYSPSPTPYTHLDEVFACYSTPSVTWRTLQFRARQDTPLAETLRLAFNDEVHTQLYRPFDL